MKFSTGLLIFVILLIAYINRLPPTEKFNNETTEFDGIHSYGYIFPGSRPVYENRVTASLMNW